MDRNISTRVTIQTGYYNTDSYTMMYVSISNELNYNFSFISDTYNILAKAPKLSISVPAESQLRFESAGDVCLISPRFWYRVFLFSMLFDT